MTINLNKLLDTITRQPTSPAPESRSSNNPFLEMFVEILEEVSKRQEETAPQHPESRWLQDTLDEYRSRVIKEYCITVLSNGSYPQLAPDDEAEAVIGLVSECVSRGYSQEQFFEVFDDYPEYDGTETQATRIKALWSFRNNITREAVESALNQVFHGEMGLGEWVFCGRVLDDIRSNPPSSEEPQEDPSTCCGKERSGCVECGHEERDGRCGCRDEPGEMEILMNNLSVAGGGVTVGSEVVFEYGQYHRSHRKVLDFVENAIRENGRYMVKVYVSRLED